MAGELFRLFNEAGGVDAYGMPPVVNYELIDRRHSVLPKRDELDAAAAHRAADPMSCVVRTEPHTRLATPPITM